MSKVLSEVLAANQHYAAEFGERGKLSMPPARRFAILTCMDARLDPAREWFVVHHTDCGMETFTDPVIRGLLASSLETAVLDASGWRDVGKGPGSAEAEYVDFLTIRHQEQSVVEDVRRIRNHPLVPGSIPIYGYVYDVRNGRLVEVAAATAIGRPRVAEVAAS